MQCLNNKDNPIYWEDVYRECLLNDVKCPQMMSEEGIVLPVNCRPYDYVDKGNYWVLFDERYLHAYLHRVLWRCLSSFSDEEISLLVSSSKDFSKKKKKAVDVNSLKKYKLRGQDVVLLKDLVD